MASNHHDDARLLGESAKDPRAFAEFYERYEQPILVYMLRRTSSVDVAADLTAEVFASALEGSRRFRFTGAPPAAWLFRIARNVLIDSYREQRVQDRVRQRLGMPPLVLTDDVTEHLDRLAAQAEGEEALRLLQDLSDDQREVVVAHVLEERGYDEIAADLQCSNSVVRKRLSRGLAVLRREMTTRENHA